MDFGKITINAKDVKPAQSTTTVNISTADTTAQIQAKIDALDKYIPYGQAVTLQFADGTYTLSQSISISGFYGGGQLLVYGNTGETNSGTLHTTQAVVLDGASLTAYPLTFNSNTVAYTRMRNFKIKSNSNYSGGYYHGLYLARCAGVFVLQYSYIEGNGKSTGNGDGVEVDACSCLAYIDNNYFSNLRYGIGVWIIGGAVFSQTNDDTGTAPNYGLACYSGRIYKNSTQPAGTVANELAGMGGTIA